MIVDNTLVFSDGQAVTGNAGSTNIIDLGKAGIAYGATAGVPRDAGKARIPVNVAVTETFNNLTSLTIVLLADDSPAFSSPKQVAVSRAYPASELVAGFRPSFPDYVPEGADRRYLQLYYNVAGTAPSTGKLFAAIVAGRQTN